MSIRERITPMALKDRLGELTRPTGAEDELAVDYPSPQQLRFRIDPKVAVAAGLVLVLFLGWRWFFALPEVDSPLPLAASSTPPATSVVVAVVGEVEVPGLHTLPPGARVADAMAVAKPYPHGQTLGLNLAQVVVDGQQIHVPHIDAGPVAAEPIDAATGKVSLNTATLEQLQTLSGVGVKTAEAIIAYREEHGGFTDISELEQVKGIGPAKFAAISPEVTL